ncbi:MAG TPA: Gfo/Idh/MocA family oxidoreductase [Rectinemataceae bacterium]
MEAIRVGLIGFGMMGRMQAEGCFGALAGRYRIVGVCDDHLPHLEEARALLGSDGVEYFTDWRRMLDTCDFELAAIVTPDFLHEEMAVECLARGKHLRLEKPMALDPAGCARVAKAAEQAGTVVQIGLELRYAELIKRMQEERASLGRLKLAWCQEFRHPFLPKPGSIPDWIVQRRYSGGTLVEKCCHHFDLFNAFAESKAVEVHASGDHETQYPDGDILDNAFVTVLYENGVRANLSLCMFAPERKEGDGLAALAFGLIGSSGRMELRDDELFVRERGAAYGRRYTHKRQDMIGHNDEITPSLLELESCIRTGAAPRADIRAGFNSVLLAWAAELSAAEKRIVKIEEMERRFSIKWME